jgi:hypothetical protein
LNYFGAEITKTAATVTTVTTKTTTTTTLLYSVPT